MLSHLALQNTYLDHDVNKYLEQIFTIPVEFEDELTKTTGLHFRLFDYHAFKPISDKMNEHEVSCFYETFNEKCMMGSRSMLRFNYNYRQLVPYVVLTRNHNGEKEYFVYTRAKSSGETRLHNNLSLGVGGHVNVADGAFTISTNDIPFFDLKKTIENCVFREITEELMFPSVPLEVFKNGSFTHVIAEPYDFAQLELLKGKESLPVGSVHMGLVYEYDLTQYETNDIEPNEDALVNPQWLTKTEIYRLIEEGHTLENWSLYVLQSI